MAQLFSAISYCHNSGFIHRDIKLQNILCTSKVLSEANVKICDFGFATSLKKGCFATKVCGTPAYVSPEVVRGEPYSFPFDIWSLGVVMFTLLTGEYPFMYDDLEDLYEAILKAEYNSSLPTF